MRYLISLLLLASCGSQQPYTAYMTVCGTNMAFTVQSDGSGGTPQATQGFEHVCGGSTPSVGPTTYRSLGNAQCGFQLNTAGKLATGEVGLSNDWSPCP